MIGFYLLQELRGSCILLPPVREGQEAKKPLVLLGDNALYGVPDSPERTGLQLRHSSRIARDSTNKLLTANSMALLRFW